MPNTENTYNAGWILQSLAGYFVSKNPEDVRVLDACCGVYSDGVNYDADGQIYEPQVAQILAKNGYTVTGIDTRKNNQMVKYNHISDIDVLNPDWHLQVAVKFDVVCFLRSWDTPEILLYFQQKLDILDLNKLTLEVAEYFLPRLRYLLKPNGLLYITDILRGDLADNLETFKSQTEELDKLFADLGLKLLMRENGLWCFENTVAYLDNKKPGLT